MSTDDKLAESRATRNGRRCPFPSVNWYPQDYLSCPKTMRMTAAEHGIYRTLLDHAWLNCGLTEEEAQDIGISIQASPEQCLAVLELCFTKSKHNPELWVNARQERERALLETARQKKAVAGKKGGMAAADGKKAARSSTAQALPSKAKHSLAGASSISISSPSPTPVITEPRSAPPRVKKTATPSSEETGLRRQISDAWCEAYLGHVGEKYVFQGAKDGKALGELVKACGDNVGLVRKRLTAAFETDGYWAGKIKNLTQFAARWNDLVQVQVQGKLNGTPASSGDIETYSRWAASKDPGIKAKGEAKLREMGVRT